VTFPKLLLSVFAFFCVVKVAQAVIEAAPTAPAVFADGQQATTPQTMGTPTVDALATAGASSAATSGAVGTQQAATQTQAIVGTSAARTATADTWTATAAADAATLRAAEQTETGLRVALLVGTLTAIPPMQTETERAAWATVAAEQTQVGVRATLDAREATQAAVVDDAAYIATVGSVIGVPTALIAGIFMAAGALTWRIKGEAGGLAQASVVAAAATIPGRVGSKPRELVRDADRAALIAFVRTCRSKSGDGSTTITPQSQFGSDADWDANVKRLKAMDLVTARPGNGGGTRIADGMTLAELEQVLIGGTE